MSNIIMAKCFSTIDDVDTSRIQGFACKPEIGELVEVMINGKFTNLEVCRITHKSEKIHNGVVPYIEVELTAKRAKVL